MSFTQASKRGGFRFISSPLVSMARNAQYVYAKNRHDPVDSAALYFASNQSGPLVNSTGTSLSQSSIHKNRFNANSYILLPKSASAEIKALTTSDLLSRHALSSASSLSHGAGSMSISMTREAVRTTHSSHSTLFLKRDRSSFSNNAIVWHQLDASLNKRETAKLSKN